MQIEQMPMVRVFFEKTGRAKYTSHLDTMRTMTRALRRCGLPLWYTQGFNPHLYMTFALPIALGYESLCESLDLRLTKETAFATVVDRMNRVLPPGFRAVSAAPPVMEPREIAWADYAVTLRYEETGLAELMRKFEVFLTQPVIEVTKRTKKGDKQMDIKPHVKVLSAGPVEGGLSLMLRLAAGISLNVTPTLFLKAFYDWSAALPDGVRVLRTAVLTAELENFC